MSLSDFICDGLQRTLCLLRIASSLMLRVTRLPGASGLPRAVCGLKGFCCSIRAQWDRQGPEGR